MKTIKLSRNAGYSAVEVLIGTVLTLGLGFGLLYAAIQWRHKAGLGSVFLHPGTEEAAQQLLRDNFADVASIGTPVAIGNRLVTIDATIAGKDCKIQLYSAADKLENVYGFTVKHLDCGKSVI